MSRRAAGGRPGADSEETMMKLGMHRAFLALGLSFSLSAHRGRPGREAGSQGPEGAHRGVHGQGEHDERFRRRRAGVRIRNHVPDRGRGEEGRRRPRPQGVLRFGEGEGGPAGRDLGVRFGEEGRGDELATQLRKTIASPITVEVSGGKITEISGIAEPERQEGAEPREGFRRARAGRIAGRGAIERHIGLILATPAQNQKLEKGKEYKQEARRQEAAGDGENGGGGASAATTSCSPTSSRARRRPAAPPRPSSSSARSGSPPGRPMRRSNGAS